MKLVLTVIVSLLIATSLSAFQQGTINVGGSLSFASYKAHSDADAVTRISLSPQLGYFIIDNLSGDLLLNYESYSNSSESTSFLFGIGARYFFNQFYGGLGFMMESYSGKSMWGDYKESANFLNIKAGFLYPVVNYVYVDIGANYLMGIGEYGGDSSGDNEQSQFKIGVGLQVFFPMNR